MKFVFFKKMKIGIYPARCIFALAVVSVAFCMLIYGCTKPRSTLPDIKESQPKALAKKTVVAEEKNVDTLRLDTSALKTAGISPASALMLKACDNYLEINPSSIKTSEVLLIKASVLYNNKLFAKSREVYKQILDKNPAGPHALESIRMTAQSYYEEKKFEESQIWYRKLKEIAGEGGDKQEAVARIAESIFKLAEAYEQQQRFKDAAAEYERAALEFPDSKIADISLFDAGLACEKQTEWAKSILIYQRLLQKYLTSKLLPKAQFRTAKCYEKLLQWNNAGETYFRVVANYPQSDLASVSLYNAGFSFESAGKLQAAAATFEKLAQLYPKSDEVADVLFKAGEIYGKIKDWPGVTRVNKEFSTRFGNDVNRVIQAKCMIGIALYMQNRPAEALVQLQQTISSYDKLDNPSAANKYYAAKAEFTIAEINLDDMNKIALTLPRETYKKQLGLKTNALEKAIEHYSKVINYKISDWTTRSVFQIGQAYEDFATGIFKQERQKNLQLDDRMALELGIAKAVEEYCVNKAAHFHEQNIKLGIKEKIEDKYILLSRKKITSLPLMAGENYLTLVDIVQNSANIRKLDGFALIAKKLEVLQKIAPFQERAINLFLKCLEMGAAYQENDEFYLRACGLITKLSFTVGETYADVAAVSRDAPIPAAFDPYEAFVYKTKLLKQIEGYEDKALENYMRTVKIAEAYKIDDDYVKQTKQKIPELLFFRARCYDLLCQASVNNPPYPKNVAAAEKDEYQARFEEIALKFQENAFDVYKTILAYAKQNYATGDFVTYTYVRMFQNAPSEYGIKKDKIDTNVITSGPEWKCSTDSQPLWNTLDFNDQEWLQVQKVISPKITMTGFPVKIPSPMWYGAGDPKMPQTYKPALNFFTRRTFYCKHAPQSAFIYIASTGRINAYLNGVLLLPDTTPTIPNSAHKWDLSGKMREGKNVISLWISNTSETSYGVYPYLVYTSAGYNYLPQPPGSSLPMESALVAEDKYQFPAIRNFPVTKRESKKDLK
jgi:tetratricopeptide (TPR) repeat protein